MYRYFIILLFSVFSSGIIFSQLVISNRIAVENKNCECNYSGPKILINEIMIRPSAYGVDGSIYDDSVRLPSGISPQRGEWIELYNPDNCRWADLSYCFLGNDFYNYSNHLGSGFAFPNGTLVPPLGFVIIRGTNGSPVPSNQLIKNGGNTVEIVIDKTSYLNLVDYRLWLPNLGGWIAVYDKFGNPLDAVTWNMVSFEGLNGQPITPNVPGGSFNGRLPSYNEIPESKKNKIIDYDPFSGYSYCRIPDGGKWDKNQPKYETYGICNSNCAIVPASKCNGYALITVSNGTPPYNYQWDDINKTKSSMLLNTCPGVYNVTVTDANGLNLTESITIGQYMPPLNLGNDTAYCNPFQRQLDAGNPGSDYQWSTGEKKQNININHGGNYSVIVVTPDNCILNDTIKIHQAVKPFIGRDTAICENQKLQLDAGNNYVSYKWSTNEYFSIISAKNNGRYSVTVSDKYNCVTGDTIQVTVNPLPNFNLGSDTSYCKSKYKLDLGSGYTSYFWSNGSTNQYIIPENSGLYWAEVSNSFFCKNRDSIHLTIHPLPDIDLGPDLTICQGDSLLIDAGENMKTYIWSTGQNEKTIYIKNPGKYYVTVKNTFNCLNTDSILLAYFPKTNITLIDTSINGQIIIEGNLLNLPYQYSIDQVNYQDNNVFSYLKPGKYQITLKDINNCFATEYIEMFDDLISIPNYFTPNGDGYHDVWIIKGISSYPDARVQIYDRFGKLIASFTGAEQGWDGKSNYKPVKSDDYWYSIDLGNGRRPIVGNVSLKR